MHVHTPESDGTNFGNWESYVQGVISAVKRHGVRAIALADYFTIDGYRRLLKDYYDQKNQRLSVGVDSCDLLIIPGVELRLNIFNSDEQSINLHVLFDPERCTADFIDTHFLQKLRIDFRGRELELKELNLWAIGKSIEEGSSFDPTVDFRRYSDAEKNTFRKSALKTIVLFKKDIFEALRETAKIFEQLDLPTKYNMVGIAGKGHGALRSLKWFEEQGGFSRAGLVREDLTNLTDFIFSNDESDRSFYLGERADTPQSEIHARFGALKPCVWGSDSHEPDTLLHPSRGNTQDYTWIKADVSFDGLRQIVFEPDARVRIQEDEPEVKTPYLVIDKVRFIDSSGTKRFPTEPIHFNSHLTSVIGGKSSGKSLLLYYIAKTIDANQVETRTKGLTIPPYHFEKDGAFDVEVTWKDGAAQNLTDDGRQTRRLTYLPQLYINTLAEKPGERGFHELVLEILLQNDSFKQFYDAKTADIRRIEDELKKKVISFFSTLSGIDAFRQEILKIGDEASIQAELSRLKNEMDVLKSSASFTDNEDRSYRELVARHDILDEQLKKYGRSLEVLGGLRKVMEQGLIELKEKMEIELSLRESVDDESTVLLDNFRNVVTQSLGKVNAAVMAYETMKSEEINKQIAQLTSEMQEVDARMQPLQQKIGNQNRMKILKADIKSEQEKLDLIQAKKEQLKATEGLAGHILDEIVSSYGSMFQCHSAIKQKLSEDEFRMIEDIELRTSIGFDLLLFAKRFEEIIDKKSLTTKALPGFNDDRQYSFDEGSHVENVGKLMRLLAKRDPNILKLKSSYGNYQDAMIALVDDYIIMTFDLIQNGDSISMMSPGKKGLVLLKLYLHLSNSRDPILIDQPEENLDNRTIYKELRGFLREKKVQRQIILVSHNANVVVGSDSEVVVVANQSGQQIGRDNREFQFEYVSGALEASFEDDSADGVLYKKGIREHVCEILEGGEDAFKEREWKYGFLT